MNYLVLNKEIWLSTVGVVFWKKKWGYFSQNPRTQPGALVLNELWNRKCFHLFSGRWCGGQRDLYFKSPFIYNSELDRGDSWRDRFPEMIILNCCGWHLMSLLELTHLGTQSVSSPPVCCLCAQVGSMGLLLVCSVLVILHRPSLQTHKTLTTINLLSQYCVEGHWAFHHVYFYFQGLPVAPAWPCTTPELQSCVCVCGLWIRGTKSWDPSTQNESIHILTESPTYASNFEWPNTPNSAWRRYGVVTLFLSPPLTLNLLSWVVTRSGDCLSSFKKSR